MDEREYFTWTEESSPDNNVSVLPIKEGHIPVYERLKDGDAKHVGWITLDEYNEGEGLQKSEPVSPRCSVRGGTPQDVCIPCPGLFINIFGRRCCCPCCFH